MKNKKASNKSNEKKEDDKLKKENDLVNPNEIASISNLWQLNPLDIVDKVS